MDVKSFELSKVKRTMLRLIKATCAIAAEEIGKEKAGRTSETAQKRYEELIAEKYRVYQHSFSNTPLIYSGDGI